MPTLQTDHDIEIHYRVAGSGPPLLNISGSGGDLRAPSVTRDAYEAAFTTLSWDQRGLGQSSRPDRPFTMADYAADAIALMDHLGWERAHVSGSSFGGMVAQELAVTHPDRVDRLVLMCTSAGGGGGASYPLHDLPDLPARELRIFRLEILDTRRDEQWRRDKPEALERILGLMEQGSQAGRDEPGREAGYRRQLEARAAHDVWDRLPAITAPTLVMAGRHDGQAPVENSEAIVSRIDGAQLRVYEGGHMFALQDERANADAMEFLSG